MTSREPEVPASATPRPSHGGDEFQHIREALALWVSPRMRTVQRLIAESCAIDVAVLITGETGTGKELVARAIHYLGDRRHRPFVKVSCATVDSRAVESDVWGSGSGALSGPPRPRVGAFAAADRGTIFLDEVGDLHRSLQAELLHLLEDGQFSRVWAGPAAGANVRVMASTNRDLESAIAAGLFREDLFYRLSTIRIEVPPLRERPEEIPGLIEHFVRRHSALFQREPVALSVDAIERLTCYPFPGNVRELENMVKRLILLRGHDAAPVALPDAPARGRGAGPRARPSVRPDSLRVISRTAAHTAEQRAIRAALEASRWNRRRAAKLLDVSYRSLLDKIKGSVGDPGQTAPDPSP